jgi:hypothetical protein
MCARQLYVKSNGQWVAALGGGSVVADGLATEQFVTDSIAAIPAPTGTDLSDYYTKPEVDGLVGGKASQFEFAQFQGDVGSKWSEQDNNFYLLNEGFKFVAQKSETYTKPEVDEAIAASISGQLSPSQIEELISQVGPVDLTDYAKLTDNTQNVVANAVVARGYAFGDAISTSNPGLLYTDTGEGYGPRLVLDTPAGVELIPYQSDFEPIKERLTTLESKPSPTVDLSTYITQVDADARYGARTAEAVSLLQGQLQSIFDSVYTRPEADDRYAEKAKTYTKVECDTKFLTLVDLGQYAFRADVYTQRQTDDRFMRIDQAFSKTDFDNQMALMLYSRKQIDDKLIAISPLGSPTINNPALAEFKQSVLDEVKLMLVGGTKPPPPDIDWTPIIRMDGSKETVSTEIQARMLGGFIELRGTLTFTAGTAEWNPLRLPPQFPLADLEANYPLAMRLVGSAVTYGFCSVSSKNRDIRVSPGARSSEAAFSGIRWKAAY